MAARRKWSKSEDAILKRLYRKHLADIEGLLSYLPGRSRDAIVIRANRIGVCGANWTDPEDYAIRQCYAKYGARYCQRYMQHRSEIAIQCRAAKLGVKRELSRRGCSVPKGDILKAMNTAFHKPWR